MMTPLGPKKEKMLTETIAEKLLAYLQHRTSMAEVGGSGPC
jgi:hypothetical protein